ncbi:hypothetical protein MKZ38_009657 [Zalerion maritima]|uniref:Uncharacterized protein n=1 Tax=Zalerion maritima TaxID=339359 RepID=A0AAD5RGP6_9PEZI|nr:hypothetical protein MKZ38_009657 [Zalerion maritima]
MAFISKQVQTLHNSTVGTRAIINFTYTHLAPVELTAPLPSFSLYVRRAPLPLYPPPPPAAPPAFPERTFPARPHRTRARALRAPARLYMQPSGGYAARMCPSCRVSLDKEGWQILSGNGEKQMKLGAPPPSKPTARQDIPISPFREINSFSPSHAPFGDGTTQTSLGTTFLTYTATVSPQLTTGVSLKASQPLKVPSPPAHPNLISSPPPCLAISTRNIKTKPWTKNLCS